MVDNLSYQKKSKNAILAQYKNAQNILGTFGENANRQYTGYSI